MNTPTSRLKSRHPVWKQTTSVRSLGDIWRNSWSTSDVQNGDLVKDPHYRVPGFDLPRSLWTTLNRIRTEKGRCQYLLHKLGLGS